MLLAVSFYFPLFQPLLTNQFSFSLPTAPPPFLQIVMDDIAMTGGISTSSEYYYLTMAIRSLLKIVREPTFSPYHKTVLGAIMRIFGNLGIKELLPFLPQIVPAFTSAIKAGKENNARKDHIRKLASLVSIIKGHVKDFLDDKHADIFGLIKEYWMDNPLYEPLFESIILLIEEIAVALGPEFKVYLPELIPKLLDVLQR